MINTGRKKVGPAGKVLVVEADAGFSASVIKRGADKPGVECGNPILCFTNELTKADFTRRYSKARKHLKAASSAGKFTMLYGIEPTKMADDPQLGELVFRRIYLIHPIDWEEAVDALAEEANLELVMKNCVKIMDRDSRVILLHPTEPPYSEWSVKKVAARCNMEFESQTMFDKSLYPGFVPRREEMDMKLELSSLSFHWFKLKED